MTTAIFLLLLHTTPAKAYDNLLQQASAKYNLPYTLLKAIAIVESSGNPSAINAKTGDYGLMQLNKINLDAAQITPEQALNPAINVDLAAKLLVQYKRRFGHEPTWACRYNLGTAKNVPNWDNCQKYLDKLVKAGYSVPVLRNVASGG